MSPRPGRRLVAATLALAVASAAAALPVTLPAAPVAAAAPPPPPTVAAAQASYPLHAVPAFANAGNPGIWTVHTRAGNGPFDYVATIPQSASSTPLFGDWDGNGTFTPGYFFKGSWVLFDTMIGRPTAAHTLSFGRSGDQGVVGDWNHDGRTDVGVFRSGTWFERSSIGAGATTVSFSYGRAGDIALTGDWNGDGVDTVGVRRGNTTFLRDANSSGPSTHQGVFGRSTDVPVVGDWNGDGVDTLGVVRGATWYLTSSNSPGGTTSQVSVPSASGTPVPYPTPGGPNGAACPTIAPGAATPAVSFVVPPTGLGQAMPTGSLRDALSDGVKTMLGVSYASDYGSRTGQPYLNLRIDSPSEELAIRGPAMSALTVAVAVAMDGYDPAHVGRDRTSAIHYVDWLVRSAACQHRSLTPGGWGGGWQSAMWANQLGFAAWLVWKDLAPQTRAYVAQVMAFEADVQTTKGVPYWKDRDGNVLPGRAGNTGAEEAAWNAGALGFAVQMMPGHSRVDAWTRSGVELAAAAYSTQQDTTDDTPVNGVPLSARLDGFNAYDNGVVENHGGIHADYITVIQQQLYSHVYARLAGRPVPAAFTHNSRLEWRAVTTINFPSPPYTAPGGIIYRPDGTVYYPQVADWGHLRYPQWAAFDASSALVGADTAGGVSDKPAATAWLGLHIAQVRKLQLRHADGHIYDSGEELYQRREQLNAQLLAMAWADRYASGHLPAADVSTAFVALP